MKITIQSRAGEKSFDCDSNELILHAGLRYGLNLPYECATGTCGTCRARVMTGEVETRWRDAPGIAKIKPDKGEILMCQTLARSDCVLRVPPEPAIAAQHSPAFRRGAIRDFRQLTKDVAHFDVHLSAPMTFEAGQFVVLETADLTGGRAYSMAGFGINVDRIPLLIKRKPGGAFSDWLFDAQRRDQELIVFGPLGRAIFRPEEKRNVVCIAGGSGIAGMMAILERAIEADHFRDHKCAVFFGVRTLADTFYLDRLSDYVAAAHGNLEVTVALSDEAAATASHADHPGLKLATGMVHEVAGNAMIDRQDNTMVYIAGPPVMVDAAIRMLIKSGMASRDIRYDKFG